MASINAGKRKLLAALVLVALISASCGSKGSVQAALGNHAGSVSGDQAALDARWQAILRNPGISGVDYDPQRITVSYRAGAKLPGASPLAGTPPVGQRAADQGNAFLRVDKSYETLTDSIAARFGLAIRNQVYNSAVRFAGFKLPSGANGNQVLQSLRQDYAGQIEWATFSRLRHLDYEPNDPYYTSSTDTSGLAWQVHKLHCAEGWDVTRGSDQVWIAILDTGVNLQHEELQEGVLNPTIWFPAAQCDPGRGDNDVTDTYGHGSGTAGLVVAAQDDAKTMTGVAPDCRVVPIRIADESNQLVDAAIVEGGYLAQSLGAKIISMSFGGYGNDPLEETMCNDLHDQGMLLFASAGNDDIADGAYPASYAGCVSVGATNIDDARISHPGWWGSNYGSKVVISAPGEDYNSCNLGAADSYQDFGGTSGACPQVAACAALALTVHPEWSNDQVRDALIETGMPTTGFTNVPRVDLGNFMDQYANGYSIPADPHLIEHGQVQFTPVVYGGLTELKALLDGGVVQDLSATPWDLTIDTSSKYFDPATVGFDGTVDGIQRSRQFKVVIDNSPGSYPLYESCDAPDGEVLALDFKDFNPSALTALHQSGVSPETLATGGPGTWQIDTTEGYAGSCYFCGTPGGGYGGFELDGLLFKQLDLTAVSNPSLSFMQHYNLEDGGNAYDRAYVLVSSDYGATWEPATKRDGSLAQFSGYVADWTKTEIDLSEFAGKKIHVAFVMLSDASVSGEDLSAPGGWWVDNIEFSTGFSALPHFDSLNVADNTVVGSVVGKPQLSVQISGAQGVDYVEYTLDCAPLGNSGSEDVSVESAPDDTATLQIPAVPNQQAMLTMHCYGPGNTDGEVVTVPIFVFNLRGDANADNSVDQTDLDLINLNFGALRGTPGYSPFFDADQDGIITESDAGAVGYEWGATI